MIQHSPKSFFEMLRRTILRLEQEQENGDCDCSDGTNAGRAINWNVVVTGQSGVGKKTFARLLHSFLRSYGVLEKDAFHEMSAAELGGSGSGNGEVQQLFKQAAGGGLLLTHAPALVDAGGDDSDSHKRDLNKEAVRALAAGLENSKGKTMVVLTGAAPGMRSLLRLGGVQSHFQYAVNIADFTSGEIAQIAQAFASKQGFQLEQNLIGPKETAGTLANHIQHVYSDSNGSDANNSNGQLAENLVELAIQQRAARLDRAEKERASDPTNSESTSTTTTTAPAAAIFQLLSEDFGIGEKLGDAQLKTEIDREISELVGMEEAKKWFQMLKNKIKLVDATGDRTALKTCLHLVITGNPGTGKTSFTRLYQRFLHAYGILPKEVFVEKNGLELKGQYVGDTGPKVKAAVAEAMGGCLFLDEAYALSDGNFSSGGDSFSREAIRTLLTELENRRTGFMCVMAGYQDKMDVLMRADPGLDRRFKMRLHLPDYSPEQVAKICVLVARKRFNRSLEEGLEHQLAKHINDFHWRDLSKQNGGLGVNLVEAALDRQSDRLASADDFEQLSVDQLSERSAVLTLSDFDIKADFEQKLGDLALQKEVDAEIEGLIGMGNVREFFEDMKDKVRYVNQGGDIKLLRTSMNMVLMGNPGTGKTTVARLLAKFLHAYGVLPTPRFVEKNGLELKGQYVGQTGPTVKAAIADAIGGCLFIDEAYALSDGGGDQFSNEAIRMLLTEIENNRTKLLVIMAGYSDKMQVLMDADPGLRRRFPNELTLSNYSCSDIAEICEKVAVERFDFGFGNSADSGSGSGEARGEFLSKLSSHISKKHSHEIAHHNGGLAVTLTERALGKLAKRVVRSGLRGAEAKVLKIEDYGVDADAAAVSTTPPSPPLTRQSSKNQAQSVTETALLSFKQIQSQLDSSQLSKLKLAQLRAQIDQLMASTSDVELVPGFVSFNLEQAAAIAWCDEPTDGGSDKCTVVSESNSSTDSNSNSNSNSNSEVQYQYQYQLPPNAPARFARAPPKAKVAPKTKKAQRKQPIIQTEEKPAEQVDKEPEEQMFSETDTRTKLKSIGVCPQSFKWAKRTVMSSACQKCHGKKTITGNGLRAGGYQCEGGSHWVCNGCIYDGAGDNPNQKEERFD